MKYLFRNTAAMEVDSGIALNTTIEYKIIAKQISLIKLLKAKQP
jgi:hypothetical protein